MNILFCLQEIQQPSTITAVQTCHVRERPFLPFSSLPSLLVPFLRTLSLSHSPSVSFSIRVSLLSSPLLCSPLLSYLSYKRRKSVLSCLASKDTVAGPEDPDPPSPSAASTYTDRDREGGDVLVGVCTLTLWIRTVDSTSSSIDDNMSEEEKMQMQCRTVQHAVGR